MTREHLDLYRTPELNTEIDYDIADYFDLSIDTIDKLPIHILILIRDIFDGRFEGI